MDKIETGYSGGICYMLIVSGRSSGVSGFGK